MKAMFNPMYHQGRMLVAAALVALLSLTAQAQLPATQEAQAHDDMTWYLDDVIARTFVGRHYFEYYYQPSAGEMRQQRAKGEVSYFLNTPGRYSVSKAQGTIDEIMASFDDVEAVNDWHAGTSNNMVKDYRHADNRFRFSIGRREVDEGGVYYVSVTEAANYYQSLGGEEEEAPAKDAKKAVKAKKAANKEKKAEKKAEKKQENKSAASTKRSKRQRKAVTDEDVERYEAESSSSLVQNNDEETEVEIPQPTMTEAERRAQARAEAKRQRELEKQQKELEKQQKKEREREEKARKEEERQQQRLARKQQQEAEKQRAEAEKDAKRKAEAVAAVRKTYYYHDIVLWLSEKYDYMVLSDEGDGCTITSSAVTDQEMAKLTIKNALKAYKTKMAVPWTYNEKTGRVEAGYSVGENVVVFGVGEDNGKVVVGINEVTGDEFEEFKSRLRQP